jgi:hypothetical protein
VQGRLKNYEKEPQASCRYRRAHAYRSAIVLYDQRSFKLSRMKGRKTEETQAILSKWKIMINFSLKTAEKDRISG